MLSNQTPRFPDTFSGPKSFKPIFFTDPNEEAAQRSPIDEQAAALENPFRDERSARPSKMSVSPFNSSSGLTDANSSDQLMSTAKTNDYTTTTTTTTSYAPKTKPLIAPTKGYYRTFVVLSFLALLMFVPPLLIGSVSVSCSADTVYCLPKIEFQFVDDSRSSPLTTIRESIKVITYFAMDLGTDSPAVDFTDKDIKEIDTFSVDNIFKINYFGYCKDSYLTNRRTCTSFRGGLDLPSVLVKDAGMSLSIMSSQGNPQDVGDSLVTGFHAILENLGDDNEIAYDALLVRHLGRILPFVIMSSFCCCCAALAYAVVVVSLLRSKSRFYRMQKRVSFILGALNFLTIASLVLNLGDLIVEYVYVMKLNELTNDNELAAVDLGMGIYVQMGCVALQGLISLGMTVLVLAKPWIKRVI
ncbi:hypothetical protein KL930_000053 [Ogataea haglerorum]|uniref:uncharacterized protein n=1 Tax=Ogataea haglerorum TaxID=1937702 RepID=UPI001C896340|nr:uncharacterized protein KL911_001081 [Ogataea haglerorum]KAG7742034.1 hypothetical protein KL923_001289 [Ogataea haglerorum]KAG7750673.1 hypothetical protein KL912_001233 [Ogataea haglerorum]KAG7758105.1 hypothetical protein KL911_001081 [Ogataea haglerorum]KAG7777928.1 hypothetical protein KL922_002746 [Ogataea haglerorum]KAG7782719.1 hypothetical protein KL930_000053 [Ogataea haglerorum]